MVRYPVRVVDKDRTLSEAGKAGIELGSWFESPLHPSGVALSVYDYQLGMCPEAEKAAREVVNLPLHPRASENTAKKTVAFLTDVTQPA
jgi:dTDP-4-amino-4,6-dideoxygalactose transaminase